MRSIYVLASLLAMAPAAQSPAQQPQPSIQQQFEAASTALAEERWDEALRQYEAIELRVARNTRSLAVVRVRKSIALFRLGRRVEAEQALRLGLPDMPPDDPALRVDRFTAHQYLGELAELALDYGEARRHYEAAKAIPVAGLLRLGIYRGLIQTQMFEDAPAALANADEALALAQSLNGGHEPEGVLRTFRGRVLLNMGRFSEARAELRTAMQRLGGLTTRVDLLDIVARSDLAIAALLQGDEEDARRYLSFTGAGYYEANLSPSTGQMNPPPCGNGLDPNDVAVLEYSVRDDGRIGRVMPIYASRQGVAALVFARAALDWAWDPSAFGEMPPLLRNAIRVEVRCSERTAPEANAPTERDEIAQWAVSRGIDLPGGDRHASPVSPVALRNELARLDASVPPDRTRQLATLIGLAYHPSVGSEETAGYVRRAIPLAVAEGAPPVVVGRLAVWLASAAHPTERRRRETPGFNEALALPGVAGSGSATAIVLAAQARYLFLRNRDEEAERSLERILATPGLESDHPAVMAAREVQTAMAASRGDAAAARAAYEAMGAGAEPCPLPRARSTGTSSRDFPREAARWGFEGWGAAESRIARDGSTVSTRTLMSYPPFVFGEATARIAERRRFDPPYLPDERTCRPSTASATFRIAG